MVIGRSAAVIAAVVAAFLAGQAAAQQTENQPAPPAPPASEPQPTAPPGATPALAPQVAPLIEKSVVSADGDEFGTVKDVLIGQDGALRAIVVERGGLFGGKDVAVPTQYLAFSDFEQRIVVNLPKEQLSQLPEYDDD